MSDERTYQVANEAQRNLDEVERRYNRLMRQRFLLLLISIGALAVVFAGLGRILWYVWGLGG